MSAPRVFATTRDAVNYTRRELERRTDGPLLAVFDIDSTVLSRRHRPIASVVRLLQDIAAGGGTIYIVTARPASAKAATHATLRRLGIARHVRKLYMPRHRLPHTAAVADWKDAARRHIVAREGRPLSLSVGDNLHDLAPIALRDIDAAAVIGDASTQLGLLTRDGS